MPEAERKTLLGGKQDISISIRPIKNGVIVSKSWSTPAKGKGNDEPPEFHNEEEFFASVDDIPGDIKKMMKA